MARNDKSTEATQDPADFPANSLSVGIEDPTVAASDNLGGESEPEETLLEAPTPPAETASGADQGEDPDEPRGPFYDEVKAQEAAEKAGPVDSVTVIVADEHGDLIEKTYTDDIPLSLGLGGAYKIVDGKRVRDTDQ